MKLKRIIYGEMDLGIPFVLLFLIVSGYLIAIASFASFGLFSILNYLDIPGSQEFTLYACLFVSISGALRMPRVNGFKVAFDVEVFLLNAVKLLASVFVFFLTTYIAVK
ncbi:TPA: hypothetical protein ACX6O4_000685 [Photobacterium damselae]